MDAPPFPAAAIAAARDAVKAHLRIDGAYEDTAIAHAVHAALAIGEGFTGTAWIARDWTRMLPRIRGWQTLGTVPVRAITTVEGMAAEGPAVMLPASAYAIDIDAQGQGWVRLLAAGATGRIRVTFAAGAAADWGSLPPPLAQGAVLLAAHLLEPRVVATTIPATIVAMWRPWRRLRLDRGRHVA